MPQPEDIATVGVAGVFPKVTRVEVIADDGRVFVGYLSGSGVWLSEQDDGRTLKLFQSGTLKRGEVL